MFIGVGRLELRIPASGSLKSKRQVVKGITGGVRAKFNVAVAEVDHQELWQRASIGVACISESGFHAEKMLREVERFVSRDGRVEIIDTGREVHSWSDLDGD
jgi:uncharacterized protein YlxP (DUF503 family)